MSNKTVFVLEPLPGAIKASPAPVALINGRYRILKELGAGGLGSVCLVEDELRDGRKLALKRLHEKSVDSATRETLQTEFLVLSMLRHPGLAQVYDFGVDHERGGFFFTADFVEGNELLAHARTLDLRRPEDLQHFYDLAAQILRTLEFIHNRGAVHGDLKPENILIQRQGDGLVTKLIDFGLVRGEKDFVGRNIMGTLYYIAPEVISGSQVDRRTDLYSFAAVLYVLFTNRSLFECKTQLSILKCQLDLDPDPPSVHAPHIDPRFEELLLRLLAKSPAERPESAAEVLAQLSSIAERDLPLETVETASAYLTNARVEPHHRHAEALFRACISTWRTRPEGGVRAGHSLLTNSHEYVPFLGMRKETRVVSGRSVILRGETGIGHESLLQGFRSLHQVHGGAFLHVDCGERAAKGPFDDCDDLRSVLLEIATIEKSRNDPARYNVAQTILRTKMRPPNESEYQKLRQSLGKLATYVHVLSSSQPIAIHFDGLERASASLLAFVEALIDSRSTEQAGQSQLFLSATVLDDRMEFRGLAQVVLDDLEKRGVVSVLQLERLDHRQTRQFVDSALKGHELPDSLLRKIWTNSDGNPGSVLQILVRLLEDGLLTRTTTGWRIDGELDSAVFPCDLKRDMEKRIRALSKEGVALGVAYAYLGDDIDLELAALFARLEIPVARVTTREMVEKRILRTDHSETRESYRFNHRIAQQILYGRVPEAERPAFHLRAGALIQNERPDVAKSRPENLARQYLLADDAEQALHFAEAAAKKLSEQLYLDVALRVLLDAVRLAKRKSITVPVSARLQLARLQTRCGHEVRAREILLELHDELKQASGGTHELEIALLLADTSTTCGRFDEAEAWIGRALDLARQGDPTLKEKRALAILTRGRVRCLQGKYNESLKCCQEAKSLLGRGGDPTLMAQAYSLMGDNHFAIGDLAAARTFSREALLLLDSKQTKCVRESTLFELSKLYKYRDRFSEARTVLLSAIEMRGRMGARDGEAEALCALGGLALFLGRYREATQTLRSAVRLSKRTGNRPALLKALNLCSEALRTTGEYEESKRSLDRAIKLSRELGSPLGISETRVIDARLSVDSGQLEEAEKIAETAFATTPAQPRSYLKGLDLHCQVHRLRGDFSRLLQLATEGLKLARTNRLPLQEATFLEHLGITALRTGNLVEAKRAAKSLTAIARRYSLPLSRGRALIVRARVAAVEGDNRTARQLFDHAREIFISVASERDLIAVYAPFASWLVEQDDLTTAFCYSKEGLYLARKLKLHYWEAHLLYVGACLSIASLRIAPEERAYHDNAAKQLQRAEKLARTAPYGDLLWKITKLQVSLESPSNSDSRAEP